MAGRTAREGRAGKPGRSGAGRRSRGSIGAVAVLFDGTDAPVKALALWREQKVSRAVCRVAMSDDARRGDVFVLGILRVQLQEHAVDSSPESAPGVPQDNLGIMTKTFHHIDAESPLHGKERGTEAEAGPAGRAWRWAPK